MGRITFMGTMLVWLWPFIQSMLGLIFRIACLARLDRLRLPAWASRLAFAAILMSLFVATLNFAAGYWPVISPVIPYVELALIPIELAAFVWCLVYVKAYAALVIVATGLLIDLGSSAGLMWMGLLPKDDPKWSVVAWALIYFGMRRLRREVVVSSVGKNSVPLWMQFGGWKEAPQQELP